VTCNVLWLENGHEEPELPASLLRGLLAVLQPLLQPVVIRRGTPWYQVNVASAATLTTAYSLVHSDTP
jgi:hypothetical protein